MSGEQQEPSMEEILASIRRIISEDPQPAEAAPPPADPLADFEPTPAAAAMPAAPVDEDPFASFEPTPAFTPEPVPEPAPALESVRAPEPVVDDVFELTPAMRLEPEPEPEPEIIPQPYYREPEPALQAEEEDRLMSAATEAAAASALAGLVVPKILSSTGLEGVTVESIVRELLRPMLREWMDNNLPTLVERLVEAEIERLSRRPRL